MTWIISLTTFVKSTRCVNGKLLTKGGTSYKAIIIPAVKLMPSEVLGHLLKLAQAGATIIFTENYPQDVPGYGKLEARRKGFAQLQKQLPEIASFDETVATPYQKGIIITGNNYQSALEKSGVVPEEMKTRYGLQCIRRSHADGHHYFISSLQEKGVNDWITLAVPAESVMLFNPMTGEKRESTNPASKKAKPSTPPATFRRKCHPANFQPCPDRRCRMEIRSRTTCQPQP